MPFALVTIGLLFIVTGFQDTYKEFFTEVEGDFTGQDSFIYWLVSLGLLGSLGYVDQLKTFSRASMALLLIVMFLANKGGVFAQFNQEIQQGSTAPVNAPGANLPAASSAGAPSSGGSTSSDASGIISDVLSPLESFF